ncbi:MAG TPA: PEGA domain-containing protein [Anaeromyxobacter sp.]
MRSDAEASGRPRYRWTLLLALGLAAGTGVAWAAARALRPGLFAPSRPHEPAEQIDTDKYLGPIETAAEPATGEQIAPFSGFAVSVETEPEDALVTIAGVERGESPVLAGVECKPGTKVPVRVEKSGFRPARATTTCRADTLVKLTLRLAP